VSVSIKRRKRGHGENYETRMVESVAEEKSGHVELFKSGRIERKPVSYIFHLDWIFGVALF
jgi:hypothetical protein